MSVFDSDATLPALPVPILNITADFAKQQMAPFREGHDWDAATRAAGDLKSQGQVLNKELREYAESLGGNASWLRPLLDNSLLCSRQPLPMRSNRGLQVRAERWGTQQLPSFIIGLCRFFQRLGRQDLPVEEKESDTLSMDLLRSIACTRIPMPRRDMLHSVALSGQIEIAVVYRGHWFAVRMTDASGKLISPISIAKVLHSIRTLSSNLFTEPPVGVITALQRDDAAALRSRLLEHTVNRMSLSAIEDCLFVVALDDDYGLNVFERDLLAGDPVNRWYDKSLQVIQGAQGELGVNVETTGCDISVWEYVLRLVDEDLRAQLFQPQDNTLEASVRHLPFYVDGELGQALAAAREKHHAFLEQHERVSYSNAALTPGRLADAGCDPETFVLLACQAAYRQLSGGVAPVNAPVSMRRYFQGRTSGNRATDATAVAFVDALPAEPGRTGLRQLFDKAQEINALRVKHCSEGRSPQAHLFGMRAMAEFFEHSPEKMRLPDLFANSLWIESNRDFMTIDRVGHEQCSLYALGTNNDRGFGVGYIIDEDGIRLMVAGANEQGTAAGYVRALEESVERMSVLFEPAS